jgi:hypothetical protein
MMPSISGAVQKAAALAPVRSGACVMRQPGSADFNTLSDWMVRKLRQFDRNLFESYRPELHYMRGPGPKWREKHGQLPIAASAAKLALPDLRNAGA